MLKTIIRVLTLLNFIPVNDDGKAKIPIIDRTDTSQFYYVFCLLLAWLGLILAVIWVLFSAYIDIQNCKHYWLAPSGAILVLAAVIVEFLSSQINNYKNVPRGFDGTDFYFKIRFVFTIIGFALSIAGTTIWAYGHMWF